MALELPFGIKPLNKLANVDERYGPFLNKPSALLATSGTRDKGLTVGIYNGDGVLEEWWFRGGVSDSDLILKTTSGDSSNTFSNGLTKNLGDVRLGGSLTRPTTLLIPSDTINGISFNIRDFYENVRFSILGDKNGSEENLILFESKYDYNSQNNLAYSRQETTKTTLKNSLGVSVGVNKTELSFEYIYGSGLSAVFRDGVSQKGISYAGNYSQNFTARSLVDKGYVDNKVASLETLAGFNGIETKDGLVGLKGNAVVDVGNSGNWELSSQLDSNNRNNFKFGYDEGISFSRTRSGLAQSLSIGNNITLIDFINEKGIEYGGDYESNFTGRSLITKNYADIKFTDLEGQISNITTKFKGSYLSVEELSDAWPLAEPGDYAIVDFGVGEDTKHYIWSSLNARWMPSGGHGNVLSVDGQMGIVNLSNKYIGIDSTYSNPSWLTDLPWSKITNTPTTLAEYGITDAAKNLPSGIEGQVILVDRNNNEYVVDNTVRVARIVDNGVDLNKEKEDLTDLVNKIYDTRSDHVWIYNQGTSSWVIDPSASIYTELKKGRIYNNKKTNLTFYLSPDEGLLKLSSEGGGGGGIIDTSDIPEENGKDAFSTGGAYNLQQAIITAQATADVAQEDIDDLEIIVSGKENSSNKSIDGTFTDNSDILFPSQKAVKTYTDKKVTDQAGVAETITGVKKYSTAPILDYGTASRILSVNATKQIETILESIAPVITDSATITLLTNEANWNSTTNLYTGAAISNVFQLQYYATNDYFFYMYTDTIPVRMFRNMSANAIRNQNTAQQNANFWALLGRLDTGLGLGLAANAAAWLTMAANTSTKASTLITPSSTDYTGTVNGMLWNNAGELKFLDSSIVVRLLKSYNNELLKGINNRMVETNRYGDIAAVNEIIEMFVWDSDVIAAISSATWTNNRASVTPANAKIFQQGQLYDDGTYTYLAIEDNKIRRF